MKIKKTNIKSSEVYANSGFYGGPGIYYNTDEFNNRLIVCVSPEPSSYPIALAWTDEGIQEFMRMFGEEQKEASDGSVSETFALKAIAVASGYLKEVEL